MIWWATRYFFNWIQLTSFPKRKHFFIQLFTCVNSSYYYYYKTNTHSFEIEKKEWGKIEQSIFYLYSSFCCFFLSPFSFPTWLYFKLKKFWTSIMRKMKEIKTKKKYLSSFQFTTHNILKALFFTFLLIQSKVFTLAFRIYIHIAPFQPKNHMVYKSYWLLLFIETWSESKERCIIGFGIPLRN